MQAKKFWWPAAFGFVKTGQQHQIDGTPEVQLPWNKAGNPILNLGNVIHAQAKSNCTMWQKTYPQGIGILPNAMSGLGFAYIVKQWCLAKHTVGPTPIRRPPARAASVVRATSAYIDTKQTNMPSVFARSWYCGDLKSAAKIPATRPQFNLLTKVGVNDAALKAQPLFDLPTGAPLNTAATALITEAQTVQKNAKITFALALAHVRAAKRFQKLVPILTSTVAQADDASTVTKTICCPPTAPVANDEQAMCCPIANPVGCGNNCCQAGSHCSAQKQCVFTDSVPPNWLNCPNSDTGMYGILEPLPVAFCPVTTLDAVNDANVIKCDKAVPGSMCAASGECGTRHTKSSNWCTATSINGTTYGLYMRHSSVANSAGKLWKLQNNKYNRLVKNRYMVKSQAYNNNMAVYHAKQAVAYQQLMRQHALLWQGHSLTYQQQMLGNAALAKQAVQKQWAANPVLRQTALANAAANLASSSP